MELEEFETRKKEFTKRSPRDQPLAIEFIRQSSRPTGRIPAAHTLLTKIRGGEEEYGGSKGHKRIHRSARISEYYRFIKCPTPILRSKERRDRRGSILPRKKWREESGRETSPEV